MLKSFIFISLTLTTIFASEAFISPLELKNSLDEKNLIILDIAKNSIYKDGHIEGSINTNVSDFIAKNINIKAEDAQKTNLVNKIDLTSKYTIEKELRTLGINNNSKVVIYHHNTKDAMNKSAYLAFVLIYSGLENVSILDGGYMSWVFQNQILVSTKKSKDIIYGDIDVKTRPKLFVDTKYLKDDKSNLKLLDARSYKNYLGILKSNSINKAGHIPKATNSFYKDKFFTDEMLRSKEDLDAIYVDGHELKKSDEVVVYADNILNASMEWFILYKEMGFKNAKIYKGSLFEWVNDKQYKLIKFKWE